MIYSKIDFDAISPKVHKMDISVIYLSIHWSHCSNQITLPPSEYYFKTKNGGKGEHPLQRSQEESQMVSSLQTDSSLHDLNPSKLMDISPNSNSLKTQILSLEPNDMDTDEHSGTIKKSLQITQQFST